MSSAAETVEISLESILCGISAVFAVILFIRNRDLKTVA